ncbi:hydrophobin-3 precursor [Pisolithus marmoratus]|nr:hydrophobin-3 precursor [Pisolithus marmoratus]
MFSRVLAVASLAALALAGPLAVRGGSSQCNTGAITCCDETQQASTAQQLLSAFGLVDALAGVSGLVGVGCTPISALAAGTGAQCNAQTVCCDNDSWMGLVNIACMPMNVNA